AGIAATGRPWPSRCTRCAGSQPVPGPTAPLSSRLVRKAWRRKGWAAGSRASQSLGASSARECRVSIMGPHPTLPCARREEARRVAIRPRPKTKSPCTRAWAFRFPGSTGSANAGLAQSGRSEVAFREGHAELVSLALLVLHAQRQVATGLQVVAGFQGVPGHLVVVVVLGVGLGHAPQVATTVVVVDDRGLPGVFVDVEVTLGVDVALAGLEGGFHVPDTVQLIAGQILVDVTGLED